VSRAATRAERRRDALALALLVGGMALMFLGYTGFRALAGYGSSDVPLQPGQRAWDIFLRHFLVAAAGLLLVLSGLGTAVWSYLRRKRDLPD
jgi:hypothetical protein